MIGLTSSFPICLSFLKIITVTPLVWFGGDDCVNWEVKKRRWNAWQRSGLRPFRRLKSHSSKCLQSMIAVSENRWRKKGRKREQRELSFDTAIWGTIDC
jgi:hypothetical protein